MLQRCVSGLWPYVYMYMYQVCTKQALCRFFEDKHVKVSLFLQDGIQKSDGTPPLVEEHGGDRPLAPRVATAARCSAWVPPEGRGRSRRP